MRRKQLLTEYASLTTRIKQLAGTRPDDWEHHNLPITWGLTEERRGLLRVKQAYTPVYLELDVLSLNKDGNKRHLDLGVSIDGKIVDMRRLFSDDDVNSSGRRCANITSAENANPNTLKEVVSRLRAYVDAA
jgi:hypothetical protein